MLYLPGKHRQIHYFMQGGKSQATNSRQNQTAFWVFAANGSGRLLAG